MEERVKSTVGHVDAGDTEEGGSLHQALGGGEEGGMVSGEGIEEGAGQQEVLGQLEGNEILPSLEASGDQPIIRVDAANVIIWKVTSVWKVTSSTVLYKRMDRHLFSKILICFVICRLLM